MTDSEILKSAIEKDGYKRVAQILKTKDGLNGQNGVIGKLALIKCNECGKEKWIPMSRIKNGAGKHCSDTCYRKYQPQIRLSKEVLKRRGRAVSIAKGNKTGWITPKNFIIRSSAEYKNWRKKVYERDNYTCQECGTYGGKLNADHIKSFAYYPSLRFKTSNGRTLCVFCHKKTPTYLKNEKRDSCGRYC